MPFLLFDRDEKVGGRVQTDEIDGYRLDRGFQVLLTAYPEAKRLFGLRKTELRKCYPGSRVWYKDKFHQVSDPFRHPLDGVCSVFNPIGSFRDKVKWECFASVYYPLVQWRILYRPRHLLSSDIPRQ